MYLFQQYLPLFQFINKFDSLQFYNLNYHDNFIYIEQYPRKSFNDLQSIR